MNDVIKKFRARRDARMKTRLDYGVAGMKWGEHKGATKKEVLQSQAIEDFEDDVPAINKKPVDSENKNLRAQAFEDEEIAEEKPRNRKASDRQNLRSAAFEDFDSKK